MGEIPSESPAVFDEFAGDYEDALNQGLSLTGESRDYYAQRRVQWLARCIAKIGMPQHPIVMDYGCGTGTTARSLLKELTASRLIGLDVSEHELAIARADCPLERVTFKTVSQHVPDASVDVIYCNGTFHHIPAAKRAGVVQFLLASLKPGGFFGLWENNPLNPGTRLVMSRIPFDKDAVTLWISESRELLRDGGFEIKASSTLFYFPKSLALLRPLEPLLSMLPFGGQYLVLAQKPA